MKFTQQDIIREDFTCIFGLMASPPAISNESSEWEYSVSGFCHKNNLYTNFLPLNRDVFYKIRQLNLARRYSSNITQVVRSFFKEGSFFK